MNGTDDRACALGHTVERCRTGRPHLELRVALNYAIAEIVAPADARESLFFDGESRFPFSLG